MQPYSGRKVVAPFNLRNRLLEKVTKSLLLLILILKTESQFFEI
jgi:hypothetical protein